MVSRNRPVGPDGEIELDAGLARIVVDHAADDAAHGAGRDDVELRAHATAEVAIAIAVRAIAARMASWVRRGRLRSTACRAGCRSSASRARICARSSVPKIRSAVGACNAASRSAASRSRAGPAPSRHSRARGSRSRPVAARDRLEDVERRGEADAFVDRQRRVLDEEVGAVQHEAALGLDRAALEHLHVAGARGSSDQLGRRDDVELHQQIGKADVARPAG